MPLAKDDLKLLNQIIDCGHTLEKALASNADNEHLNKLTSLIGNCKNADDERLQRLSFHTRDLSIGMTARHLAGILVPFERLLGRALRDDEFMVSTVDKNSSEQVVRGSMIVVAENLRSAFNVGAILRTADCFGVDQVILSGYTPTPEEEKTAKTSMGAENAVRWSKGENTKETLDRLKSQGYEVVALETSNQATSLQDFAWPNKPVLVLGNERFGVDQDILSSADHHVKIPMHGIKNSLNVGIAFGIAAADWQSKTAKPEQAHTLKPIGVFKSTAIHPYEARRQGAIDTSGETGVIELLPGRNFEQALSSLEGFERIWLLYRFHHNENWKPMVLPPRGPNVKRGVFATRAPYRPNPIGLSSVELVRVQGRKIEVRGFDLLDGTPIYDIKPYVPYADAFPNSRTGWLEEAEKPRQIILSDLAQQQIAWLETKGIQQLKGFLHAQLENNPLDTDRKRVVIAEKSDASHVLSYRTWKADFVLKETHVEILQITSNYVAEDLANHEDRYSDKEIHREFNSQWASPI